MLAESKFCESVLYPLLVSEPLKTCHVTDVSLERSSSDSDGLEDDEAEEEV